MKSRSIFDDAVSRIIAKPKSRAEVLEDAIRNIRAKVNKGATPQDIILLCDKALGGEVAHG
jgi:hypothetical protein